MNWYRMKDVALGLAIGFFTGFMFGLWRFGPWAR